MATTPTPEAATAPIPSAGGGGAAEGTRSGFVGGKALLNLVSGTVLQYECG